MNSKDVSYRLGHRERLRKKFSDGKLVDYELLELLLTYAIPRCDVHQLARELIDNYGSLYNIITTPYESLLKNKGIKENTAIFIKSIHEIMMRGMKNYLSDKPIFHDYQKLSEYCKLMLHGKNVEEFHILYLDSEYKLLFDDLHSSGTTDWAAVYPREILKRALELNAMSIVMLHNHPQSQTSFSLADIEITTELRNILKSVNIDLFDHLLVSGNIVYSAKNMFLIK
ncbi:MAG: RadC family protein [Alphaproteobacteria bacterium]|nr:RadC family protein [Alphaproteobacteria bacterium]MBN2675434.1 RadC family protein [Alphaproteobacteria bacterium]